MGLPADQLNMLIEATFRLLKNAYFHDVPTEINLPISAL